MLRLPSETPGLWCLKAAWIGFGLFLLIDVLAAFSLNTFGVLLQVFSLVLLGLGCVAFARAFYVASQRSRREKLSVAEIYLLMETSTPRVAGHFRVVLVLFLATAIAVAATEPYTDLAFGILAPTYGVGLMGLWGANYSQPKFKK